LEQHIHYPHHHFRMSQQLTEYYFHYHSKQPLKEYGLIWVQFYHLQKVCFNKVKSKGALIYNNRPLISFKSSDTCSKFTLAWSGGAWLSRLPLLKRNHLCNDSIEGFSTAVSSPYGLPYFYQSRAFFWSQSGYSKHNRKRKREWGTYYRSLVVSWAEEH
jgi:hypothetical protein